MSIKEIKKEMLEYQDFYGGDFIQRGEIKKAKSKKELNIIIENHRDHMELMLCDANSHLDSFKRKIGL